MAWKSEANITTTNKTFICNPPYDAVSLQICANAIKAGIGTCNSFTNILPAKDGSLFHMYGERYKSKHNAYMHSRLNPNLKQKENQKMYKSYPDSPTYGLFTVNCSGKSSGRII